VVGESAAMETHSDPIALLQEEDSFAAIDRLDRSDNLIETMSSYSALVKKLYWEEKDLAEMVMMARAAIQFGLSAAWRAEPSDPSVANQLRQAATAICYNLASFTWPGWDEPGIRTDYGFVEIGLDAARCNVRLATELGDDDEVLANSHWMLGAQEMAVGEYATARESFETSVQLAKKAGLKSRALLALAFVRLVSAIRNKENLDGDEKWVEVLAALREREDGAEFAAQAEKAYKVFSKRRASS